MNERVKTIIFRKNFQLINLERMRKIEKSPQNTIEITTAGKSP